jgi:hypothetical protein
MGRIPNNKRRFLSSRLIQTKIPRIWSQQTAITITKICKYRLVRVEQEVVLW